MLTWQLCDFQGGYGHPAPPPSGSANAYNLSSALMETGRQSSELRLCDVFFQKALLKQIFIHV